MSARESNSVIQTVAESLFDVFGELAVLGQFGRIGLDEMCFATLDALDEVREKAETWR